MACCGCSKFNSATVAPATNTTVPVAQPVSVGSAGGAALATLASAAGGPVVGAAVAASDPRVPWWLVALAFAVGYYVREG